MTVRAAFGPGLRIARERAGIPLDEIARATKIKVSLLAELENNDVSHWPRGIYRRAFFREYLAAIGSESDSLVAEFVRLFPDDGTGVWTRTPARVQGELRLTLARVPRATGRTVLTSVASALIDICLVLLLAGAATWLAGVDRWAAAAAVALTYYGMATAFNRRTPGVVWLGGRHAALPTAALPLGPPSPETLPEDRRQRLHVVSG